MSCQINNFAGIIDICSVKKFLFPSEYNAAFDWDDAWDSNWQDEHSSKSNEKLNQWLQDCHVSLSSTRDVLVIARKNVMVILISKWDSQEESDVKSKFHVSWHGKPPCILPGEEITSVLCIPLISQGRSSHFGTDWTCIVVGFSSGYVRFYTETISLLIEELLHNEPVTQLKCQSYNPPRHSHTEKAEEELYVIYEFVVCVFPGFGLFSTLRACRNQLARVRANCSDVLRAPPLTYKKWGLTEHYKVSDCEIVGPVTTNTFDHLLMASTCGGFAAAYRTSAPQHSLMLATGNRPFIGFHYALEGEVAPVLIDVVKGVANNVANKLKSTIRDWWPGQKPTQEKPKEPQIEPSEPMLCRFGLCDVRRNGDKALLSPNKNLCVVCDGLGRVILVDTKKGIALRMWKGYREAQCGWIEVQEQLKHRRNHSTESRGPITRRTALFLVIFSPRKGTIEIWTMQHGPKVATFKASKSGRLLYTGHYMMGTNSLEVKNGNRCPHPCVFVDSDGSFMDISVPFHFALSDKNSKRAHDLHLMKKLKTFLKTGEYDSERQVEEVKYTMNELKTNDIRLQAIEMLSSNRCIVPEALFTALSVCIEKVSAQDPESHDPTVRTVLVVSQQLQKLIVFYQFLYNLNQKPPEYTTVVPLNVSTQNLSENLHAPEAEVKAMLDIISVIATISGNPRTSETRVAFADDKKSAFSDFISCFEVETSAANISFSHNETDNKSLNCQDTIVTQSSQDIPLISLKTEIPEDRILRTSELIFQGVLYSTDEIKEWQQSVKESGINPPHLMKLSVEFWLNKKEGAAVTVEMLRFGQILISICSVTDTWDTCDVSSWWNEIRSHLTESTNPFMALTGAIVCRSVALITERNADKTMKNIKENNNEEGENSNQGKNSEEEDEGISSGSDWENMSTDICQWTLLVNQLENVALLDAVLRQKPYARNEKNFTYIVPYEKISVSLNYLLSKGRGSVSELVARWLIYSKIEPQRLIDRSDREFYGEELLPEAPSDNEMPRPRSLQLGVKEGTRLSFELGTEVPASSEAYGRVLEMLRILKQYFPCSLSSSIILANICWEHIVTWTRSPDLLEALQAAISCLQSIPSPIMARGVCSLIWTIHLGHRFENGARLVQKVGKIPKERLCRQEIGISDLELPLFFKLCVSFLDTFLEASLQSGVSTLPDSLNLSEDLWNCTQANGSPPLTELALTQPSVNYDLLHLHYELAMALHMLASFNMRFPKLISNLFDNTGQAALFCELSSEPQLPSHNPDAKLIESRTQFLLRVISGAVQSIQSVADPSDEKGSALDTKASVKWVSKCHELSASWHLSIDTLRRHQICELYSYGYDRLAEEIIPAVNDTVLIGSQLLVIVGQRVKHIILTSPDLHHKVVQLSPALSTWIDSLDDGTLHSNGVSMKDTAQLLAHVLQFLPESHRDYHLAVHMVEAVQSLLGSSS